MKKKNADTKNHTPEPPQVIDPTSKKEREQKKAPHPDKKGASPKSKSD